MPSLDTKVVFRRKIQLNFFFAFWLGVSNSDPCEGHSIKKKMSLRATIGVEKCLKPQFQLHILNSILKLTQATNTLQVGRVFETLES